jgi:tetratricopeptide (TPR) repeat protein
VSNRAWPDGHDPVAAELRRALDEAERRVPDDVTLRRGWAAFATRPGTRSTTGRRNARLSWFAGGMASTAALALACAAWLWPRVVETPERRLQAAPTAAQAPAAGETPAPDGSRRLTLEGGVEAQLQHTSVMRIEGSDPRVEDGAVQFKVPHRRPGHPFVVRAERYRVIVLGTQFGVSVNGDRRVDVDVDEGVVEVWSSDVRLARLERGQRWNSTANDDTAATAPAADGADRAANAVGTEATGGAADDDTGHQELPPAARAEKLIPSGGTKFGRSEAHRRQAGRATRVAVVAGPARATESPASARAALAAGDAPRALEIYRNLAQKTGPGAENAAYEIGRILNERGQSTAAVAAWRRYRSDYPNGILRVEADVSIIETLARAGESDDALTEATDFLRRRPDSERRGEIARVAGDLYRARGDCRHAVGAYQVALSTSRVRDVADAASFHRAACLVRLGDGGGVDALRGYLRAYPDGRFKRQAGELVEQATSKAANR